MPIFNQIELFLDGTYSKDERRSFLFKSRCICNYLERALAQEKYESSLSRVNIICTRDENEIHVQPLKGAPNLEVRIKYDLPDMQELDEGALQRNYIEIIKSGLKSAQSFMPINIDFCIDVLKDFEAGKFKNEWIHTSKTWKRVSLKSEVVACLTTLKFELCQHVFKDENEIAKKIIVTTKPREMLFAEYLGSLSMDKFNNIIYRKNKKVLTIYSVDDEEFKEIAN